MIALAGADSLHKIFVLNPKGGSGKTTLATNLASCFAQRGDSPIIVDLDPNGYCIRWLQRRPINRPEIFGLQPERDEATGEMQDAVELPTQANVVIVDLPAAIPLTKLHHYTYIADTVLLPIAPSEIDVYAATRFIAELLLDVQLDRREQKLAIVANRVRSRTKSYGMLMRFLTSLRIPLIATLRDSQNFVAASALGVGICELPRSRVAPDVEQLEKILGWIDRRRAVTRERQALIARAAHSRAQEARSVPAGGDSKARPNHG